MNINKVKKSLYNQTPLKILSFLSLFPGKIFSAHEISEQTDSSKGATNQTLRLLVHIDILNREKRGNVFLYKLNTENIVLKQFKIFENILKMQGLIRSIKPYCYQIILFGSGASGINDDESDIDLFVKTEYKDKVSKIIYSDNAVKSKIRPVIQDPLEISASKKTDNVFLEQVKKGIILWEGKPEYEEI